MVFVLMKIKTNKRLGSFQEREAELGTLLHHLLLLRELALLSRDQLARSP
jgi:hypothetical protein